MPTNIRRNKKKISKIRRKRIKRNKKFLHSLSGGAVLPSEYFGRDSGRYGCSTFTGDNHQTAYGPMHPISHGRLNASGTVGPNLAPYPNAVSQTGGKRSKKYRKHRHQNGAGMLSNFINFFNNEQGDIPGENTVGGGDSDTLKKGDEPEEEPVRIGGANEPEEEPVSIGGANEPEEEPVRIGEADEPEEEPVRIGGANEPEEEPVRIGGANEPEEEPVSIGGANDEPEEEPVSIGGANEPEEEPVRIGGGDDENQEDGGLEVINASNVSGGGCGVPPRDYNAVGGGCGVPPRDYNAVGGGEECVVPVNNYESVGGGCGAPPHSDEHSLTGGFRKKRSKKTRKSNKARKSNKTRRGRKACLRRNKSKRNIRKQNGGKRKRTLRVRRRRK